MAPAATTAGPFKFLPFIGNAISGAAGFSIGRATAPTLHPLLQDLTNRTWALHTVRPLDVGNVARLAAEQRPTALDLGAEAAKTGFSEDAVAALVQLARVYPDLSTALTLLRRGDATDAQVKGWLNRHGFSDSIADQLILLRHHLLDPSQLAAAIHRGLIPDPGLLKGEQPDGPRKVEAYPVYPIDALDTAAGSGFNHDQLGVLVGLQGLPMGPHEAAQALFRGVITHGDYIAAFNQSNSRNEWAQAVLDQSRQIPTARDFLENALRGYRDLDDALKGAARHGMSEADATMIYQNQGRPMVVRQITQALSRGGVFKPEPGEITDPYDAAIVEGNLKPAYYDLAKQLRYTLPSPFVMRQLTASGVWSEAKAAKRLKDLGWIPQDADEAAHAWATGTGTSADPHVTKAHSSLWTTMHRSYIAAESDAAALGEGFDILGVSAANRQTIIKAFDAERDLIRKQLTPAQIKKAWAKAAVNAATGQPWTQDEALAALIARGYSATDARSFLNIP